MKKTSFCVCLFFLFFSAAAFVPAPTESVFLPVLMYHSVSSTGKSVYIVTEKQLENDLIYLTGHGYETVSAKQLCDYADGVGELPEKPILLTFDDGHYNNLSSALPLLKKYGCKAVVCVIGKFCEYSSTHPAESHRFYSYLTWEDVTELASNGNVEIGSHTYAMHDYSPRFGIGRIKGENDAAYERNLREDLQRLNDKLHACGVEPIVFAYPFGRYNSIAQNTLLSLGFRITLTCNEGVNKIEKGNPKSILHLKRFNRSSVLGTEKVFSLLRPKQGSLPKGRSEKQSR